MSNLLSTTLGRLRITGLLEGTSFLLLVGFAMPLKYFFGIPGAVRIIGMTHGILFIAYVTLSTYAKFIYGWSFSRMLLLWIASVLPFGTFIADYKLLRVEENAA
jgi:integral membrane protein